MIYKNLLFDLAYPDDVPEYLLTCTRKISKDEKNEIENMVKKVSPHIDLPCDPVKIANKNNIIVRKFYLPEIQQGKTYSGILHDNDEFAICVNENNNLYTDRFMIAHSLGHYFFNHMERRNIIIDSSNPKFINNLGIENAEGYATEFAYSLLLPKHIVEEKYGILRTYFNNDKSIIVEKLAEYFIVSKSVMKNRLIDLGLIKE